MAKKRYARPGDKSRCRFCKARIGTVEVVSLARAEWSARVADRRQTS